MTNFKDLLCEHLREMAYERDAAKSALLHAHETIAVLENEIAAIKFYGDQALGKVADAQQRISTTQEHEASNEVVVGKWIGDIWLSTPANASLLGDAEMAWQENVLIPQQALNLANDARKRSISKAAKIKCALFVAAVQFSSEQLEESCASANEALRECDNDWRYKDLAGVAHYLRGRILLESHRFAQAYWDFSLAIFTKGYHERAKYYQGHTSNRILQKEEEDTTSPSNESASALSSPTTPGPPRAAEAL